MKRDNLILVGLIALLLCTTCIAPVSAHRAFVGAFMTGDIYDDVMVRAWYEGNTPMAEARITIYAIDDGLKEIYIEDVTDRQGFYAFEPKWRVTEYEIVVEHTGHRARMTLDLESGESMTAEGNELPLAARIIAGFGYLLGIAGIAMIYTARKMQRNT